MVSVGRAGEVRPSNVGAVCSSVGTAVEGVELAGGGGGGGSAAVVETASVVEAASVVEVASVVVTHFGLIVVLGVLAQGIGLSLCGTALARANTIAITMNNSLLIKMQNLLSKVQFYN